MRLQPVPTFPGYLMMTDLQQWIDYASSELGVATCFDPTQEDLGRFYLSTKLIKMRTSPLPDLLMEVWFHELGHYLAQTDHFGCYGDWMSCDYFVKKYWRLENRKRLKAYHRSQRREELVVQCFALWATDWTFKDAGHIYIDDTLVTQVTKEVNHDFKRYLRWLR